MVGDTSNLHEIDFFRNVDLLKPPGVDFDTFLFPCFCIFCASVTEMWLTNGLIVERRDAMSNLAPHLVNEMSEIRNGLEKSMLHLQFSSGKLNVRAKNATTELCLS